MKLGNGTRRKIPQADPHRRVEVAVTRTADGRRKVLLRDLSHGQGIGWYAQKTIALDPEQVDALVRALCCARSPCASDEGSSPASTGEGKIIKITSFRDDPPRGGGC